ncbi:hypothetical protein M409DRAFT_50618 [Zasmidium cellare ATCC 36951]|uniref:Quinate/shikimate 5-dehydrogenase/glutamyl-tRNA reductase domain-containing protein n=1 Tax=Zasmidium cellare ATCC 36951 TaxID=1080233 RepID=A0A6A6D0P4_ZASCE|nr:uncharacterized protein M409DRAFT_50618 [Zasmidium cellare ATCC 36951]KAF2172020.1 hypothetical protein M409DRAFT_50618 [Zasmidium cellare ATCC 36951]
MSGLRVLGDEAVHGLLIALPKSEILVLQGVVEKALHGFSTAKEREHQPEAAVINRPEGQKVLFRLFTSPSAVGTKIIVEPATDPTTGNRPPLHGVLVICDNSGIARGLVNAEEVTAFRTSLSAIIPWSWRKRVDHILVFGAGKQALWHIRLALALRGDEIKSVTVVNRSLGHAVALVNRLKEENRTYWKSQAEIFSHDATDNSGVDARLAEADAVFCTVPSQEVLFTVDALNLESRRNMPYVSAIGSWQPQMIELDPLLLVRAATASTKAYILVDDRNAFQSHTGEGVRSGLNTEQVLELGKAVELRRKGTASYKTDLDDWLRDDLVVYKSVGVSLTDLAIGEAMLKRADQMGIGSLVPGF